MVVIEEWLKANNKEAASSKSQKKKYLKQVKILRDEQKLDANGEKLPSGLGFAEFDDESLALFAIRYLNNMELVPTKGLISDYSLEDARALHKREKRLDRQKQQAFEKKKELKKQQKTEDKPAKVITGIVDLGSQNKGEKPKELSVDQITDQELLHRLLRESISRGKRQRIKKRLAFLSGETIEEPDVTKVPLAVSAPAKISQKPLPKQPKPERMAPAEKVATLLKKREAKEKTKKHNRDGITEEDREIIKKVKGKKKENKRQRARETDEFDLIMQQYKQKILKSLGSNAKFASKAKSDDHEFEEVEMSD